MIDLKNLINLKLARERGGWYNGKMAKLVDFKIIIERDEDGRFVASAPEVPGCYSEGETYEEAMVNIKEALGLCLEVAMIDKDYCAKIDWPEVKNRERFIGIVDLKMPVKIATC